MKSKYFKTENACRICSNKLQNLFRFEDMVLSGVFPNKKNLNIARGPLTLSMCKNKSCNLVQLKETYNLESMYGMNYDYRSSLNKSMANHLINKVRKILDLNVLKKDDVIIDIGSNDATTLKAYPKKYNLVGVDPTCIKFKKYYTKDIKVISDFFPTKKLKTFLKNKKAKVITSFSMFYDLKKPISFAKSIKKNLHKDGIWVMEQSYLKSMLEQKSFDTICHEHIEYYTLKQIDYICNASDLRIIDVEFNDINGGSFSVNICHRDAEYKSKKLKIKKILNEELKYKLDKPNTYKKFFKNINKLKKDTLLLLKKLKSKKKIIAGLGASTKGNILLQHYNIDENLLDHIADVNKDKYNCFTPKTNIKIISESNSFKSKPDYFFVLPWHFKNFFLKSKLFKNYKLIFPLPKLRILKTKAK